MNTTERIAEEYTQNILQAEEALQRAQCRINYLSMLRLALFIEIVAGGILFWQGPWVKFVLLCILPLAVFLWTVKRHNQWFRRRDWLRKFIEVNRQELQALKGDHSAFDEGSEYIDPSHSYTLDLDVFGSRSLFQALNRTTTNEGRNRLAWWLGNHLTNKGSIEERQIAVSELAAANDFRLQFRVLGLLHHGKTTDTTEINAWAESESFYRHHAWLRVMPAIAVAANATAIALTIAEVIPFSIAGLVFASFVTLSFGFTKGFTKLQNTYGQQLQILSTYAEQVLLTEQQEFHSPSLQNIRNEFRGNDQSASKAIKQLARLLNALDQRSNVLMAVILNGLFFWELRQVIRIERWRETHARDLPRWLDSLATMDAHLSLATFAHNHPDYVIPQIVEQTFRLESESLGHPLMNAERTVLNDIHINRSPYFIIITGANMAGKSTYLRTIGVNYLLTCIGAPVRACTMIIFPAKLVTSLRTSDSLADNESYFFAELKRLKMIIDRLTAGEQLFIILDEILKGTNSVDKQKGSRALLKQFMEFNATGIIATHDLLLSTLADIFPENICNQRFEADIVGDELSFSYRLRDGVAQNMNACFLMKKMGIAGIDE